MPNSDWIVSVVVIVVGIYLLACAPSLGFSLNLGALR